MNLQEGDKDGWFRKEKLCKMSVLSCCFVGILLVSSPSISAQQSSLVTHELREVTLLAVLESIAEHAGKELAISPKVDPTWKATSVLNQVEWRVALDVFNRGETRISISLCDDVIIVLASPETTQVVP